MPSRYEEAEELLIGRLLLSGYEAFSRRVTETAGRIAQILSELEQ